MKTEGPPSQTARCRVFIPHITVYLSNIEFYRIMISGACVFIHSHKVKDGKLTHGLLLYPGDRGRFKTGEARQKYQAMFKDKAPFLPYADVGKRYAETTFTEEEIRDATLKHMRSKGWEPKEVNEDFWKADQEAQDNLEFPLGAVREKIEKMETAIQCAIRGVWEETGMKVDPAELKYIGRVNNTEVYEMWTSMDRAVWEWMNHQAERRTLTDWGKCPHTGVLDFLGVSRKVKDSYCETFGGPKLVTDISAHLVEEPTRSTFHKLGINYK